MVEDTAVTVAVKRRNHGIGVVELLMSLSWLGLESFVLLVMLGHVWDLKCRVGFVLDWPTWLCLKYLRR